MNMGNLGWYQIMTTMAKKVNGPKNLFLLVFGGGALAGGCAVASGGWFKRKIFVTLKDKKQKEEEATVYTINKAAKSNEGLQFSVGERFKVLEKDGDAGLIEKIDDDNSPYFVSLSFLSTISNYVLS